MATDAQPPKDPIFFDQMSGTVVPFPGRRVESTDDDPYEELFRPPAQLSVVESDPADKPARRRLGKNQLLAIGSALVAVTVGGLLLSRNSSPDLPPYKTHVSHIAEPGETLSGIAERAIIEENASGDPRGRVTMNAIEAAGYLHTELNPAAGTVQNPNDDVLQPGERVVGDIPLTSPNG